MQDNNVILTQKEKRMNATIDNGKLVVCLEGKIGTDNVSIWETGIRELIRQHPEEDPVFDAEKLTYISSAGLRLLLSLQKERDRKLSVVNVDPDVYEIFEMTGFTLFMDIQKKRREISVEGCEVIGRGAFGTVYRIDRETIVKVYDSSDSIPLIETERQRARQAIIKGVPTAISYDIVKVGDSYGSVFELIQAENLNDIIVREPEQLDKLMQKYIQLMKTVHSIEALPGEFPAASDIFDQYLDDLNDVLPEDVTGSVRNLLHQMPEDRHLVHGDFQMKNVMMNEEEPILIDMETLCTGNPVFDLQSLYFAYRAFNEDEPDNNLRFMGLTEELSRQIWEKILSCYFSGYDREQIRAAEDKIRVLAYLRFLDRVVTHGMTRPDLKEIRVKHTIEQLRELLARVDSLVIC